MALKFKKNVSSFVVHGVLFWSILFFPHIKSLFHVFFPSLQVLFLFSFKFVLMLINNLSFAFFFFLYLIYLYVLKVWH